MKIGIMIVLVALVLVGGFLIYKGASVDSTGASVAPGSPTTTSADQVAAVSEKVIEVQASRWQYSPGTNEPIKVKKGDHVKLTITNKDTKHGIFIPDFGVTGIDSVEFTADKVGTFSFQCPTMCGAGHKTMKGTIVVEE